MCVCVCVCVCVCERERKWLNYLISLQAGSNDRKRDLVVDLIDKCGPSLVTGRMADIYALGQVVVERGESSHPHTFTPSHPHTLTPVELYMTTEFCLRMCIYTLHYYEFHFQFSSNYTSHPHSCEQ